MGTVMRNRFDLASPMDSARSPGAVDLSWVSCSRPLPVNVISIVDPGRAPAGQAVVMTGLGAAADAGNVTSRAAVIVETRSVRRMVFGVRQELHPQCNSTGSADSIAVVVRGNAVADQAGLPIPCLDPLPDI